VIQAVNHELGSASHPIAQASINTNFPLVYNQQITNWKPLELGRIDVLCPSCHSKYWIDERSKQSTLHAPTFERCCKKGDVRLANLVAPPEALQALVSEDTMEAKHFRKNIQKYNSALSFTSLKYSPNTRATCLGPGIQCFQIHGELYHLQGPLEPSSGQQPKFSQLFLYDPQYAVEVRHNNHPELREPILHRLTSMLHEVNPFISLYKIVQERLAEQTLADQDQDVRVILNPQLRLILEVGKDKRRHNLPMVEEVAMVIPTEYDEPSFRDIILATRGENGYGGIKTINATHAGYMPLHYVLLFPRGELGWHWSLELEDSDGARQKTRMPQRAFYRYRLHVRANETTLLFQCQRLFQQYLVDAWASCDQNKLDWLRSHQSNIRADVYNGLVDIVRGQDLDPDLVGRSVVLPSSYTGGDWFMQNFSRIAWLSCAISVVQPCLLPSLQIQNGRR
jgi:hypothetical protein